MASAHENENSRPPFSDKCKWCGKDNLEWFLDKRLRRWYLIEMDGKRHVHQPELADPYYNYRDMDGWDGDVSE